MGTPPTIDNIIHSQGSFSHTLVSLIEGGEVIEGGCSFRPIFNRRGGANRRGGIHVSQFLIEGGCSRQPVFSRRGLLIKGVFQVGQFLIKLDC